MADKDTIALYDARAEDYGKTFSSGGPSADLRAFIDAMPQGAKVLDLGCGPGSASARMTDAGLNPDPVDASAGMIAEATKRGLPARQATFAEITGTALYDGIWANFSLTHAARDAMPGYLAALHQAAKPGARLHIGLKTGTGELRDPLGRLYTLFTVTEITDLVHTAGFTISNTREGSDRGFAGTTDPFVILTGHA